MKNILVNNGSFLEGIINLSIEYYNNNFEALFYKRLGNVMLQTLDFKVNNIISNISGVDYYGIWNGKYITIEAKEITSNIFFKKY